MATNRKYTVIAKISSEKFVKYRTNYPEKIIPFLQAKFGACLYANFYFKSGDQKGQIAGTWGKNKGFQFN
jgi:hypothetical protein